jgi:hypothetical protein
MLLNSYQIETFHFLIKNLVCKSVTGNFKKYSNLNLQKMIITVEEYIHCDTKNILTV